MFRFQTKIGVGKKKIYNWNIKKFKKNLHFQGKFGLVMLGEHLKTKEKVAVKILSRK